MRKMPRRMAVVGLKDDADVDVDVGGGLDADADDDWYYG